MCVDGVVVNDSNGCYTSDGLPVDWLKEKFGGLAVGKFSKKNRRTFVDEWLGKGRVEDSVEGGFVNCNGSVDPVFVWRVNKISFQSNPSEV